MNSRPRLLPRLLHQSLLSVLMVVLLLPLSTPIQALAVEVIVEEPQLHPVYSTCPESYWYPFTNNRGHTAYLTLNVKNPANSTNYGEWHPVIPQAGYYQVSAYVAAHSAFTWCTGEKPTIQQDTTDARYSIHYAYGITNRTLSQYPLSNQWLDLGEYYFTTGQAGYVSLVDMNAEPDFTTSISFSAVRFTFTRPTRPQIFFPFVGRADPSVKPPGDVGVVQAQGFDSCHLPSVSSMDTWWHQSPYAFYALYLGGAQLASLCTIASASWVSQVHQQGWSFVPTWVGPQAPCTNYTQRMSSDPAVSYQQGRQEAQAASTVAASLGLSSATQGGTIIYYDLEAYGNSTPACRQPVSAFMNGWVQRLHELGNLAGGYGTRNSFITDWAAIPNAPDDVWPAAWYADTYDPYASVYGIPWLQGLWTTHQRVRQYAGDHSEHWGGVGLGIDSDVADGMVAMPPAGQLASPTIIPSTTIDDAGWLS
ncbi:MAG TPA: glycoside hydrolase domain-containing protein, partial [Anaerolineales bacterium]